MQRKLMSLVLLGAATVTTALYTRNALATPSSGFTASTLARGRLGEINSFNHSISTHAGQEGGTDVWLSLQKTKGLSDLFVQSNVWAPGGSTGWHTHPGHSLIIVTSGELTVYGGDDPGCEPKVYTEGMGFVDSGGNQVHNIRNETNLEARTVAVQLIPADATRRIDAERPEGCPF